MLHVPLWATTHNASSKNTMALHFFIEPKNDIDLSKNDIAKPIHSTEFAQSGLIISSRSCRVPQDDASNRPTEACLYAR